MARSLDLSANLLLYIARLRLANFREDVLALEHLLVLRHIRVEQLHPDIEQRLGWDLVRSLNGLHLRERTRLVDDTTCETEARCQSENQNCAVHSSQPCREYASRLRMPARSEEHTSELQSRANLVCRLLLEKKK